MNPLLVVGVFSFLAGIFTGTYRPFAGLKDGPHVAEVHQLQGELTKAQQDAKQALLDEKNARSAERSALIAQVRSTQEDALMAKVAVAAIPDKDKTQAIRIAEAMVMRVNFKLSVAIGDLPSADHDALVKLVAEALAGQQAKFDEANAARDTEFKQLTAAREADRKIIIDTAARALAAETKAETTQGKLTEATNQVTTWAQTAHENELKAGSFFGAFSTMRHWAYGIGIVAVLIAGLALYLRMGLGSVGRGLHGLQKVLPADQYEKLVSKLDGETDGLHQWLISLGRKKAAAGTASDAPHP